MVCVRVRRAHLFLGFQLLEGLLLFSCQVDPSQSPLRQFRSLALLTVVSCLRYPVAPTVFDGLLLSGEEVYAMRLYSFSLDPVQASDSCHLQEI
ncbi:hypothetical protein YC2023_009260 [Brassica napus]